MARKTFLNGYPLPASDINTYLMDQSVQSFASATARTAALATPTEGMVSYLADTDTVYVYNGSAWNAVVDAKNFGTVTPYDVAGKNKIINGGFDFWQRGTSFTGTAVSGFTADRWISGNFVSGDTISQQIFTPGSAPLAGYEGQYYLQMAIGATAGTRYLYQKIEDVRTLAGQTATLSFFARVTSGTATVTSVIGNQNFGSGGSAFVGGTVFADTLTTTWQRFTHTAIVPSVSGKTIGAGSNVEGLAWYTTDVSKTIQVWGVQLEAGSVATPFSRAGGTLQGEETACYRYLAITKGGSSFMPFGNGMATSTTAARIFVPFASPTRPGASASIEYGGTIGLFDGVSVANITGLSVTESSAYGYFLNATVTAGLIQYRPYTLLAAGDTAAYIRFPREL